MKSTTIHGMAGVRICAAIFLMPSLQMWTMASNAASAQDDAKAAKKELRIPRAVKPWKDALRLVGDGNALYSDFTFIKDKRDRWHCIGTFGKACKEIGTGYVLSDGYALFHAVGDSLESPMVLQDKIPYEIASPQAFMWAPAAIWNRDRATAFLFYFHYLGSSEFKENGFAGKEHGVSRAGRSRLLRLLG
jgi:hypothetical protein